MSKIIIPANYKPALNLYFRIPCTTKCPATNKSDGSCWITEYGQLQISQRQCFNFCRGITRDEINNLFAKMMN